MKAERPADVHDEIPFEKSPAGRVEWAVPIADAADAEILEASIKAGTIAQIVIAAIAVIGLIYLLKLVLVTTLASMLLAYVLDPAVNWLGLLKFPRWLGSLVAILLIIALFGALAYYSYNSLIAFTDEFPTYSEQVGNSLGRLRDRAYRLEAQAKSIVEEKGHKEPVRVTVEQPSGLAALISRNSDTLLDLSLAIGFVPFLAYFMLTLKEHSRVATVRLFPKEHRLLAHRTVGTISAMIRSYIIANLMVGVLNSILCSILFWALGIKYAYFIGIISGFLGIVPYVGVFASLLPPLATGIETLDKTGIITVIVALIGIHILTMNVIYPKFVGKRLNLNPLVVSISLLFWAWIWGPPGLVLAIPLLGAAKIICDHIEPLRPIGAWLGESLTSRSSSA